MKNYSLLDFHSGIGVAWEDINHGLLRPRPVMSCGPSDSEKALSNQAATMSSTLQQNYNTRFANQSAQLGTLNQSLTPIVEAGPNQTGFNAQELAAQNTQALDTTGANYANAARALNSQLAGRGGNAGLESGVDEQIKAGLASQAAGQLSNEQLGITQANYATGRAQYNNAVAGVNALAGLENPEEFASLGTNANQSAFKEADTVSNEQNQATADIVSAGVGLGMDALTFGAGAAGGGGITGGIKALSGFGG